MPWMLLALGCSTILGGSSGPLSVDLVRPEEGVAGGRIELVGGGFTEDAVVYVQPRGEDDGPDALPIEVPRLDQSPERWVGTLPAVPAGPYELVVTRGDDVVRRPLSVEVPETPCVRGYQANTQLSVPSGKVIIERFYADGTRERVVTAIADIDHLEYQLSELEDGRRCGAILLRMTDGAAVVFEDAAGPADGDVDAMPLRERAETVARFLDRTLVVP